MGLWSDWEITSAAVNHKMISPFFDESIYELESLTEKFPVLSYGLSSYGYDARLAPQFKLFRPSYSTIIDVKNPTPNYFEDIETDRLTLPPHSYVLGKTMEWFEIPRNVLALCIGKSTYTRAGFLINVTPLEPGWRGEVTLEIGNLTPAPAYLYANEGICQFLFFEGDEQCLKTYADKAKAKYQDQRGVVFSRM